MQFLVIGLCVSSFLLLAYFLGGGKLKRPNTIAAVLLVVYGWYRFATERGLDLQTLKRWAAELMAPAWFVGLVMLYLLTLWLVHQAKRRVDAGSQRPIATHFARALHICAHVISLSVLLGAGYLLYGALLNPAQAAAGWSWTLATVLLAGVGAWLDTRLPATGAPETESKSTRSLVP